MKATKRALALMIIMSLSIPTVFSETDISVDYAFDTYVINDCDTCNPWMMENVQIRERAGEPLIPYRAAAILLPQGTAVKDVKVKHGKVIIEKGIDIPWGHPPCTFSDTPKKGEKNEEIYSSDNKYPDTLYEVTGVQSFRGFTIVYVNLFPVQYQPKSGTIHFYTSLTVEVHVKKGDINPLFRGLPADKAAIAGMVDNPGVVDTYTERVVDAEKEGVLRMYEGGVPFATEEYIIITNSTLQNTFQTLANHKSSYVNGTGVYTVSWIYSNYTGGDNQEKIRNFIKDKYNNNGLKWCLLGGDIAVVPYRGFYVSANGYTDYDMAADMYYGCLDGTFNDDSDGYWAEPNDGVDWLMEVYVGRAPVETTTEAQGFVDKVTDYEQAEKPEKVQFHQARVVSGNNPDSRCLAWNCDNYVPSGWTKNYLFEQDGNVSKTDWENAWATNPLIVQHIGHGSQTSYQINLENGGLVTWYNSDVSGLTNTFWPWTTSVACLSGQFEYSSDCLAETYVKDDCGAIAAFYNDNYGWFSYSDACMFSGEFVEMQFKACFTDGKEKFGELLNKSKSYLVSSAQSDSTYRWCYYEINLIGDPETPCLTKRGEGEHGGKMYNGHEYKLISTAKTWANAKNDCLALGGHLVSITSSGENNFVSTLAGSNTIWIGFTDEASEGTFQWVTGEDVVYTNWSTYEPNNCCGGEDYAEMVDTGLWNDNGGPRDPNLTRYYVCEWEEHGGTMYNKHEYRLYTDEKTWANAKSDCLSRNGHLVSITSSGENDFVSNLAGSNTVWIGFTDEVSEGTWQWITGESVVYTNWAAPEPNDYGAGEDYGEMISDGTWNDCGPPAWPTITRCYVCEWVAT
jgi:hypothetical protein